MPTEKESQILTEAKKHQVQTQEEMMIMRKLCTGIFQICCYYQVYFTILAGKCLEKKTFYFCLFHILKNYTSETNYFAHSSPQVLASPQGQTGMRTYDSAL